MPFTVPDVSSVGFDDPRAAGGLPTFPANDPGAEGMMTLGKGVEKGGLAAADIGAMQAWQKSKIEGAYATADLRDRLAQAELQIKSETDPAKVTQLRGQLRPLVSAVSQQIGNPDRRDLWLADNLPLVSAGEVAADQRSGEIWRGNFASGLNEKISNAQRRAAQSDDPSVHADEAQNISDLIDAGAAANVIPLSDVSAKKRLAGEQIITGHADVLTARGEPQQALDYITLHADRLPPHVLETYTRGLEQQVDKQGVQSDINGLWGGADKGYGGNRGAVAAPGPASANDPRGMIPVIQASAAKYGVDPDVALKVARSEGLDTFAGDGGTSYGAFQLHVGGGLGDNFRRDTGLDPSDPKNEPATIDYAMSRLADTGWTPYHGAALVGVGARQGIGSSAAPASASAGAGGDVADQPPETGTFPKGPDDPSPMHYERDGGGWKIVPGAAPTAAAVPVAAPQQSPAAAALPDIEALTQRAQDKADSGEWTQDHANSVMAGLRSRFNHLQGAQAADRAVLTKQLSNGAAMLADGRDFDIDPAVIRHFYPQDKADEIVQQLNDAKEGGQILSQVRTSSPDQLDQMRAQLAGKLDDPASTDYAKNRKMLGVFDTAVAQHQTQLLADPSTYVSQNSPTVLAARQAIDPKNPATFENYATASLAEQTRLGVPPAAQHILGATPNRDGQIPAEQFASIITSDPEHAPKTIQNMATQYGNAFPMVWRDLTTIGKLPAGYQLVGQLADYDPGNAATLSRVLATPPKDWQALLGTAAVGAKSPASAVKESVPYDPRIADYERSLKDSGASPAQVLSIRQAVESLALGRVFFGREDAATAVDKAIDAVTGHYSYMPGGARVPQQQFEAVTVNAGATLQRLDTSNVAVPALYGVSPALPKPEEYVGLLKANPTWITAPSADALWLMDSQAGIVRDKAGAPISVPFNAPLPAGYVANQERAARVRAITVAPF